MIDNSSSLESVRIPATCVTSQDYIKVIDTEQEFQQVVDLMKEVFPDYWRELKQKGFQDAVLAENNYIIGYFNDKNELLGSVRLQKLTEYNVILLFALQVRRTSRNKGIATDLFRIVKKYANELKVSYILLNVDRNNHKAIKLYERWNFKIMPRVYLVKSINIIKLRKSGLEDDYFIKTLENENSHQIAVGFLSNYFPQYLKIFGYKKIIKQMIREKRLHGVFLDQKCHLLVTETNNMTQLDIYISQSIKERKSLISTLLLSEMITINSYENIILIGNINLKDFKILRTMGITLSKKRTGYSYYYETKSYF